MKSKIITERKKKEEKEAKRERKKAWGMTDKEREIYSDRELDIYSLKISWNN